MPLPPERVITGTYVNPVNGEPYDGTDGSNYVIFEPVPARWTDQNGNQILLGGGKVTLDENGQFSESVVRTDAEGVLPEEGRAWRLRQYVAGTWSEGIFTVPDGTGPLDITDVLSVDVCGVDYVPVPGPPGSPGTPGVPGQEGASAYEVAVEEGFSGTEEEWLASLVGPQGEPGLSGGMDTGITSGGDISVNASNPLAVDINPLEARIVDYLADPVTVTEIASPSVITVVLDSVAQERTITWLLMDADLNVYQQGTRPTPEDRRTLIVLGMVAQDGGGIFLAQSIPVIARQPVNQLYDLMDSIGAFGISGNDVSPNGTNLMLNVSAGQVFSRGWNHFDSDVETNNPHILVTVGASPAPWTHALRASNLEHSSASTTVDVGHYDNAGVLTPVPAGDTAVVHQLWMFPTNEGSEIHVLQYGQQTYADLDTAVGAVGKEAFSVNPVLPGNAINLGFLVVRGDATDLSSPTQALFVKAGKFGSGPGGGAAVDLSGYALLAGSEFTGQVSSLLAADENVAQSSRTTVNTSDLWRRLASGEMQWGSGSGPMDTFLKRLGVGLLALVNSDLLIGQEDAKSYRFRQSGASLDMDASGADLFLSVFELVNFLGEQYTYLRLESGEFTAHASGKWIFGEGPFDGTGHTIDGLNNLLGFFGAAAVGKQPVTGERTTGAALQSLLAGLELLGLVDDTSTAGPAVVETVNSESGPDVILSAADVGAIDTTEKGVAGGVASLGLDGLVPDAQLPAAPVTSVNGETGAVTLDSDNVGAVPLTQKGVADGVASLGADGKVPAGQLPAAPVTSVNGETGDVSLNAADVGALDQATADGLYMAQDSLWINGVDHGVVGDGTTDDAPALNAILSSSPAGSVIAIPPREYAIGVPIVVPPGKTLTSLRSDLMTVTDLHEPNAQIKPLPTFTGVAAIRFLDATDGGYADISGEQRVLNITLDGSSVAAGVDGIQAKGNIQNVALRDVTIRRFPNSGIYCGLQGGVAPYSWRMHRVMLDNNHGHGMFGERMVDLTAVDCQAIGNWSNGWMLQNAANSQMLGCRAEWNGNHGFCLSGDWGNGTGSGGMLMSGCSTDRNGFNGVYLDCTGTPPIVISNLMTRRDGRNGGLGGGGYAGLATNGATTPLIIGDWTNFPGVDDDGASANSPEYGGSFTDTPFMQVDNAYLHAATSGLFDGGGNGELRLGSNITYAVGTTDTFTRGRMPLGEIVIAAEDSASNNDADFVCTGTNDHLVIQQVIDMVNAAPGKGRIRLLDGTFNLGDTINWPGGVGLGLVGSGWGTVLKLAAGVNDYAFNFSGTETRSTFSDFTIDGNHTNQTAGPTGGIWGDGAVECVFQRIHFTACKSSGLFLGPMTGGAFGHNNIVTHCLFDNANDSTFEGNAIYLTSSDENVIVASDFQFLGGSGPAMGMIHDTAGTQTILGCNFVNGGNSRPAVRVQDASATKIVACNFDGVAGDAIFLAASNCVVESNTIFGIGAVGTAGAYSGIHLEYAATGNLISGNSISSHTVNGAARSLIREESIGDSGNNSIVGNMLITKGTLSVGALDLNAPGTLVRSNKGGGAAGDPVVTTAMVGAASGVASLDVDTKIPVVQIPELDTSQIGSGIFDAERIPDLSSDYVDRTGSTMSGLLSIDNPTGQAVFAKSSATAGAHALTAYMAATSGTTNSAINAVSDNPGMSAVQISGKEIDRGTMKVSHLNGSADATSDGGAAALSVDLRYNGKGGTAAQALYITATDGPTTGSLIVVRNQATASVTKEDFVLRANGRVGLGTGVNANPGGKLEIAQNDDTTVGLLVKANSASALQPVLIQDSAGSARFEVAANGSSVHRAAAFFTSIVQLGATSSDVGGVNGVAIGMKNVTTAPSTNPTGGIILFSEGGVAKVRQADGAVVSLGELSSSAFIPSDYSMLAWTQDPAQCAASTDATLAGDVYLSKFKVVSKSILAASITYEVSGSPAGLTSGQNFVGIYSSAGTLLATSGDQTTNFGSAGSKTGTLTASVTLTPGYYYLAFLANGTTPPTFMAGSGNFPAGLNAGLATASARSLRFDTSATTLPSSITLGSCVTNGYLRWGGIK